MAGAVVDPASDVLPSGTVRIAALYALNTVGRTVASDAALNGCQGSSVPSTDSRTMDELLKEMDAPHSTMEVAFASA
jgi:hypothetical protein